MNLHSKEKTLILAIAICGLIMAIGTSFAYFTGGANITGNGGKTNVNTSNLIEVKYDAGTSALSLTNAIPGSSKSKNFSITMNPTSSENSATYAIKLNISSNGFVKCSTSNYDASTNACQKDAQELVYTLKDGSGTSVATGDITGQTGEVLLLKETKTSNTDITYNYTLEIDFKNTNYDQNHNMNKQLNATLKVEFAE